MIEMSRVNMVRFIFHPAHQISFPASPTVFIIVSAKSTKSCTVEIVLYLLNESCCSRSKPSSALLCLSLVASQLLARSRYPSSFILSLGHCLVRLC